MKNDDMHQKIGTGVGFIAALDQSGGSTPKALRAYGVQATDYSNDREMFDRVHEMRTRIITSERFGGDRILGAILFEDTMNREIGGKPSARCLWEDRGVVPFLKVDQGLAPEEDGVQLMKPLTGLDKLLKQALANDVFGTKMRSVISRANPAGIQAVTDQQFEIGRHILSRGLLPIIEPEVDIHSPEKARCEALLRDALLSRLDALDEGRRVMLKLTLPSEDGFYAPCIEHPKVLRVAALSGGYSREQANQHLVRNPGMIASFSRALTEGLDVRQSEEEFDELLDASIQTIFEASRT